MPGLYGELLDDPFELDLTLTRLENAPASADFDPTDTLRLRVTSTEFVVRKPVAVGNPVAATNALLKALHAFWFDDLNRHMVHGEIVGTVPEFAHLAAAVTACEVALMLHDHADRGYKAQCGPSLEHTRGLLLMRLTKLLPVLELRAGLARLPDTAALVARGDTRVRTDHLWQEMNDNHGQSYDLSSYMYLAKPLAERLQATLRPDAD